MLNELGHFALVLALAVALVQTVVPLVGAHNRWPGWMAVAEPAANAQLLLVGFSFAALTHGFVVSDFSLAVVYQNSHSLKPMLYKVSGVWGNHEGSMLSWITVMAFAGGLIALIERRLPARTPGQHLGRHDNFKGRRPPQQRQDKSLFGGQSENQRLRPT